MHPGILVYAARTALASTSAAPGGVIAVRGVPNVSALAVRPWRSPTQVGVTIEGLCAGDRQRALRHPVVVALREAPLEPAPALDPTRGRHVRTEHADWFEVADDEPRREVVRVEGSREIWREVPHGNTFVMTCRCGRKRYAPARSIEAVKACHPCTDAARRGRRALRQRAQYEPKSARAALEERRELARRLRSAGLDLDAIASTCGRSISWASRVVRKP